MYFKIQFKSECFISHFILICVILLMVVLTAPSIVAQVFEIGERFGIGTDPGAVVTADFDGDEDNDLAVAHRDASEIWIFSNDGAASFSHSHTLTDCEPENLCVADLNSDGYNDLLWFDEHTALSPDWGMTFYFNNGDGTFSMAFKDSTGSNIMCAGDFDGDGNVDVAVAGVALDDLHVALLFGTGEGSFAAPV
ncbi:MAG: VCBS repeat-containing protein, partial [candidate division Zixibacteria bacterium]|nr:VCBS repeat-containing protein [candidate division Zixibacteria bacterium]